MLTNNQIEKLNLLSQHPKFGNLLQEAMNIWEGLTDPQYGDWGVYLFENKFWCDQNRCCLIGAALVNKKVTHVKINKYDYDLCDLPEDEQMFRGMQQNYNISNLEFHSIWRGFDGHVRGCDIHETKYDEEAFQFGLEVRKILFPND